MIDTSKIKAGDKVRIDGSPNWREVLANKPAGIEIHFSGFLQKIHHDLITGHRPAKSVVPKGEGCVVLTKTVWLLCEDGTIFPPTVDTLHSGLLETMIAQGNVSNNRQHLERKRDRQRIEQELLECDGAVYEPVGNEENYCWGIVATGNLDCWSFERRWLAKIEFICHFINIDTAEAALEKVGAERIRKAWGINDD